MAGPVGHVGERRGSGSFLMGRENGVMRMGSKLRSNLTRMGWSLNVLINCIVRKLPAMEQPCFLLECVCQQQKPNVYGILGKFRLPMGKLKGPFWPLETVSPSSSYQRNSDALIPGF